MRCLLAPALVLAIFAAAVPVFADEHPHAQEHASPPKVGDIAPDFTLKTLKDEDATLSALAAEGPVVLVVLRGYPGYQCPICTRQMAELIGAADKIAAHKARVLLVYPGPADHLKDRADEFVGGKNLPEHFTFVIDPDYTFTHLYHLRWDAKGETAYPSTFVLDTQRQVHFAKVSKGHGGRASASEVIEALDKVDMK